MAEDLSIPQIQQSVKNKTLPGYVGIPILQNKVNNAERMKMAQGIAPDMGQEPPIADQVMARADALQGIDSVATGAGGGMVAFNNGGVARFQNQGLVSDFDKLPIYIDPSKGPAGSMGDLLLKAIPSMDTLKGAEKRIDPVTGKPVTFGEYLRLQDRRAADAARATLTPTAAPALPLLLPQPLLLLLPPLLLPPLLLLPPPPPLLLLLLLPPLLLLLPLLLMWIRDPNLLNQSHKLLQIYLLRG
jgi:hypothetical protein